MEIHLLTAWLIRQQQGRVWTIFYQLQCVFVFLIWAFQTLHVWRVWTNQIILHQLQHDECKPRQRHSQCPGGNWITKLARDQQFNHPSRIFKRFTSCQMAVINQIHTTTEQRQIHHRTKKTRPLHHRSKATSLQNKDHQRTSPQNRKFHLQSVTLLRESFHQKENDLFVNCELRWAWANRWIAHFWQKESFFFVKKLAFVAFLINA